MAHILNNIVICVILNKVILSISTFKVIYPFISLSMESTLDKGRFYLLADFYVSD